MTISVAARKSKGRKLQYWVCEKISAAIGIPWKQDDDNSLIQSRPGGQSGVDVILRGEAQTRFKYSIECKNQETWSVHAWVKQAKANQKEGTDWLIVAKRSREDEVVIMDAERFFDFLKTNIFLNKKQKGNRKMENSTYYGIGMGGALAMILSYNAYHF